MPALENTFNKWPNKYFIETGTGWDANGLIKAHKSGQFSELRSCEGSYTYYKNCLECCKDYSNIRLYHGLSESLLETMIADIDSPCTFWLDSHFAGGDQARGIKNCPLMEELDIIKRHPIKTHTILIDDIRCCGTWLFDGLTVMEIMDQLYSINPGYKFEFQDCDYPKDILVAHL